MATAVITGGARGIGRAISELLADDGYDIVMCGTAEAASAEDTVLYIKSKGVRAFYIQADVSVTDEVTAVCDLAVKETGRIDVLVNNAGITRDGLMLTMSEEDFDKVTAVNLKGCWSCCKGVLRTMLRQKSGRIINISSVAGTRGNPGQTNYCASKAGIIGITKSLAKEVGAKGITVNAVAPGFIETDMTDSLAQDVKERLVSATALRRAGTAYDVAGVVAFLASERAAYITGQVIEADGGM